MEQQTLCVALQTSGPAQVFTLRLQREAVFDLGEVQHHGQLVYLLAVGQVAGRHDRGDAQLLLQDAEGQLVVVNAAGLVQGRHVAVEGGSGFRVNLMESQPSKTADLYEENSNERIF